MDTDRGTSAEAWVADATMALARALWAIENDSHRREVLQLTLGLLVETFTTAPRDVPRKETWWRN